MFLRTLARIVNAARGAPVATTLVAGLLGAVLVATAIAATSSQSGGPITAVKVVRGDGTTYATSQSWEDIPGATTTITVPSGQRALIVARFSAESSCTVAAGNYCTGHVRILIGGVEAAPGPNPLDPVFDSTNPSTDYTPQSHAIERSRGGFGGLPAGTYEVKARAHIDHPTGTSLKLVAWHLTVERSQTG